MNTYSSFAGYEPKQ